MRLAEKYFPHGNFIGGHPMAGAELSGVSAAHPLLFKKAVYLLTPTSKTRGSVISSFSRFVTQLGARPTKLEAETHDHAVAAVSHLAQLTAVALTNVVGRRHPVARRYLSLAAGGFRDMTRIASSDPTIWRDILELNAGKIHLSLRHLQKELKRYESLLRTAGALDRDFKRAKKIRAGI
jgi:prephenate dehydrogenase